MLKVTILCILVLIISNTSFSDTEYFIEVSNIERVNNSTFEFDVYIKAQTAQFELTSYQCAFSFNTNISSSPSFVFSYINGSSQLTNIPPAAGIGVNNSDGELKLTFASLPGKEFISSKYLKIGRFRLSTSGIFNEQSPEIKWCFSGKINTIFTGANFEEVTDSSNYVVHNYGQLNILNIIASSTDPSSSTSNLTDRKDVFWKTNLIPAYLIFDLGESKFISQTKFSFYNWQNGRKYTYSLFISNDTANWSEVVSNAISSPQEWTINNFTNIKARYIKLLITANSENEWATIWEVQIYGSSEINYSEKYPLVNIPFKIEDEAGHSNNLFVGIDSTACDGLDSCLGETEYPQPPSGIFSAWLNVPNSKIITLRDYRYGSMQNNFVYTYQLQIQRGSAEKIVAHWNLPLETKLRLQDIITGDIIDTVFYPGADSLTISNPKDFYKLNLTVTFLSKISSVNLISSQNDVTPKDFVLYQNYPNPFNPSTNIKYSLPHESNVSIIIFNALGERVKEFEQGIKEAGNHNIIWQAADIASGIYFCTLTARSTDGKNNFRKTRKMMLLK